jgi:replicative DNA helicase
VKKAALETLTLMEQGQWEAITEVMTQAVQAGCSLTDLGTNYFQELAQRIQDRAGRRVKERIPTGIPELDSMTNGGLKKAQVGMVVGGTGRGKSIFLQWLARVAILMGKRVVYITMELPEDEIADRFDSMFARVKPFELNDYQTRVLDEVGKVGTMFGSSLIIKHYPMDTATVNTFKTFIRKLSGIGIAPDLILVDYLDLIKPHRKYNNKTDEQDAVMKGVVGMGQELNIATWTAAQLNRAGLVMETPDESAQAGSISRQFAADLVLWLAQTPDERQDELLRLVISKNRNGLTGKTISLDTDYSYMTFYREQPEVTNGAQEDGVNSEESTPVADEQRDLHVLLEQSQE